VTSYHIRRTRRPNIVTCRRWSGYMAETCSSWI